MLPVTEMLKEKYWLLHPTWEFGQL